MAERALGKLVAGKFLAMARRALPDGVPLLTIKQGTKWITAVRRVEPGPGAVLNDLGRYVHRTAIGDSAILAVDDDSVTFRYTDSRTRQRKRMRLPAREFLRRLLQHVLPKGFPRVRTYGLLHASHRVTLKRLQLMRRAPPADDVDEDEDDAPRLRCPHCRGALVLLRRLTADECLNRLELVAGDARHRDRHRREAHRDIRPSTRPCRTDRCVHRRDRPAKRVSRAVRASFAHALPSPWTATPMASVDATTSHRRPRADKSP